MSVPKRFHDDGERPRQGDRRPTGDEPNQRSGEQLDLDTALDEELEGFDGWTIFDDPEEGGEA